jgi:DNA-binding beta-propeller fold protein YncE
MLLDNNSNEELEEGSDLKKRKRCKGVMEQKAQEVNFNESHGFYYNKEGDRCFVVMQESNVDGKIDVSNNRENPLFDSQEITADPGDV